MAVVVAEDRNAVVIEWLSGDTKKENHLWYSDYSTGTIRNKSSQMCIELYDDALIVSKHDPNNKNQLWECVGEVIRSRTNPELVFQLKGYADAGVALTARKYTFGSIEQMFEPFYPRDPVLAPLSGPPPQPIPSKPDPPQKKLFYIVSRLNGFVMDISGANANEGALVISYPKQVPKQNNQLWYFDEDGLIRSALNDFVPCAAGKAVQLKMVRFTGGASQRFRLDGSRILNGIGECVDIRGASKKECAQIITYPHNGDTNQQWFIQYV
ncbi:hypothetical protein HELRODRAFT_163065 [Helobdella robusta]|uniref:Ricin B lectin domain-containing protein n=1 Tax=Helobdella robusta TaxID=6412 RepID=T1ETM2_HELRO|nr:hypothetical protein HELRODRAFT_163065 [Helobdella robusta]ESN96039.1 hypothetical protein HELRODRAFT_163065 [Helobdella robusta]